MANLTAARSPEGRLIVCQFVWGANSSAWVRGSYAPVHRPVRRGRAGEIAMSERAWNIRDSRMFTKGNGHNEARRDREGPGRKFPNATSLRAAAVMAPRSLQDFVDGDGGSGMIRDRENRRRWECPDADTPGLRGIRAYDPAAQTATSLRNTVAPVFRFGEREIS
jgi:hypothetical protein